MVATPDEIAVAWVSGSTDPLGAGLHFARLDHSLARLSQSGCLARFTAGNYPFVSLARTSRGWLLAASGGFPSSVPGEEWPGMVVIPLDSTGSPSGPRRTLLPAIEPRLVGADGGAPLLIWQDTDSTGLVHAALLCDDASEVWRVDAFDSVFSPTFARTATFTGDGFLVGEHVVDSGFLLRRLELDGSLGPPITIARAGYGAELAWDGAEARLVYQRLGDARPDGIVWQRLSRAGEPVGDEVVLSRPPVYTDASMALRGRDTVIALAGGDTLVRSATRLDFMRVGAAGEVLVSPFAIRRDLVNVSSYRVVSSGDDVFVGWASGTSPFGSDWRRWRMGLLRMAE